MTKGEAVKWIANLIADIGKPQYFALWHYEQALSGIRWLIETEPEIIRCKDCKHADDDGVCQNSVGLVIQDDDDFCSRAERRTE